MYLVNHEGAHILCIIFCQTDLNAMINGSMEKRRQQEEVLAKRVRAEEQRCGRAAILLQAGARGYITRKKYTPILVALSKMKKMEKEKEQERLRTQAAVTIQVVWKGYRYM